ncbi:MAG: hypothetical protein APF76_03395 [Desulfitibacter sp. BRH_c19]|nr:MAG: hypothetical protein APF76_03395 [Desulfitibacter sp. BRH_c19]
MNTSHVRNTHLPQETVVYSLEKLKQYWMLIKSKQTFLLVITGWAGFSSGACPLTHSKMLLASLACLFLVISGCTMFNMILDRDIDAKMNRTAKRPLPSGALKVKEVILWGSIILLVGLGWAFLLSPLFGLIVAAGVFIDLVVYTILLKRTTAFSILFGGISGGMPILAGRALGLGTIDTIGVLLALAILLWIPTHIMTFSIKYRDDYSRADIPTFPSQYGVENTRKIIAMSTIMASISMILSAYLIGMNGLCLLAMVLSSIILITFATIYMSKSCYKLDMRLFKMASIYMLVTMILIGFGA